MKPIGMQEYCEDCFYGYPENCPHGVFRRCTKAVLDELDEKIRAKHGKE